MAIPSLPSFRRALAGTPMAGEAGAIYQAALSGGLNPAFVAGLASAESSFGSAGYARGTKNPYGLGVHLGWTFPTYAAATKKLAETLGGLGYPNLYNKSGLAGIISQYTPASDGNNEGAHRQNIIAGGRRTGGDASQVYVNRRGGVVPITSNNAASAIDIDTFGDPRLGDGSAFSRGYSIGADTLQAIIDYMDKGRESIRAGKDLLGAEGHQQRLFDIVSSIPQASSLSASAGTPDMRDVMGDTTTALPEGGVDSGKLLRGGAGGTWGGALAQAMRLQKLAGITPSSQKRSRQNTASGGVSDHWVGSTNAYAVDLPGSPRDGRTDAAAQRIVRALGGPAGWGGGNFVTTRNGYRYQVIWKSNVGGNHYDHIHVGVRRV